MTDTGPGLALFGIHVSIVIVDGVVDEPRAREKLADKPDDFFVKPECPSENMLKALSRL